MVDFLKEHTWCSPEMYKWVLSVAQIRLMTSDYTHIEYLDRDKAEAEARTERIEGVDDLMKLGGIPVIKK